MSRPSVTVAIPVLNESASIKRCLEAVSNQTYPEIVEVLVVDGGSTDDTRVTASAFPKVRILANPATIQAAGLNIAVGEARGEVFVRVDGHAFIAPDYVERCVDVLQSTAAAIVGGPMRPVGSGWRGRAIALALASPFGAGPAKFHTRRFSGSVDTVYLGAFRTAQARAVGGYAPVPTNEDAEFAHRMAKFGGIWMDTSIQSTYAPRESWKSLARQFFRYGCGRAATVRRHPKSLSPRQMAAPTLIVALALPGRRRVLGVYAAGVATAAGRAAWHEPLLMPGVVCAMVIMHLCWGTGFWIGLIRRKPPRH